MSDDRSWIRELFDVAMQQDDYRQMRSVMEVALERLHGEYISVGDRERRLSQAHEVIGQYQKQLEWAWQFVPPEVIAEQRERRVQMLEQVRAAVDQAEFARIIADFDNGESA